MLCTSNWTDWPVSCIIVVLESEEHYPNQHIVAMAYCYIDTQW